MKNILKTIDKNFSILFEFRKDGNHFEIGVFLCVINRSCDSQDLAFDCSLDFINTSIGLCCVVIQSEIWALLCKTDM